MIKSNSRILVCLFIFLLRMLSLGQAFAQNDVDTDKLFETARQNAFDKKYTESKRLCKIILASQPQHIDAMLLLGRVYSWENQYDSARWLLNKVFVLQPKNLEAFDALSNVELWAGSPDKALEVIKIGLSIFPRNILLMLKKATILVAKNDKANAIYILEEILILEPENTEAKRLLDTIKGGEQKNIVSLAYNYSYFTKGFSAWQRGTFEYTRKFKFGSVIPRVNYAYLFDKPGLQLEMDMYPKITKKTYVYLNAGYSPSVIFPKTRFGAEIYQVFLRTFEVSAGIRGLYFQEGDIYLYTAQLTRYYKNFMISGRAFAQLNKRGNNFTEVLLIRKYLKDADSFVSVQFSTGSTPLTVVSLTEIQRLGAKSIQLDYQAALSKGFLIKGLLGFQSESYVVSSRNRYSAGLQVMKQF